MDEPPRMLSDVFHLKEQFIRLYERDHLELQQCIKRLSRLVKTFEEDFRCATEASRIGGIAGISGRVAMIAGLALAPFTLGASAVVGGAGAAVAAVGGIGGGIFNFLKMNQQEKICQNIKNGLEEFQNKIIPMIDILKGICQCTNEILSELNKPEYDISAFSKCVASASELICMYDIDKVAAQLSKLAGTLEEIFAGLVHNIHSVIDDNEALDDMDNLAKNGQISESEINTNAGKFIVKMRKVIHELQNIMDELKKTKDIIEKGLKPERSLLTRMFKLYIPLLCVPLIGILFAFDLLPELNL
ncbi:uncharacterized protein LOC127516173 [Ctenopharyngodon idella]|uniref:uncharacterized protein LOC127516173 n=1 Tax=Ctenopharyngodon idella TaxID=7959 RepID=UPI00222E8B6F|nr:uncharacterized protein LOC127516173 [Ctenopharyngodon idella]